MVVFEVVMVDRGFELGRNFGGETGIRGDLWGCLDFFALHLLIATLLSLSGSIRCNSVVSFISRLASYLKVDGQNRLTHEAPFLFLEPVEAGGRVFTDLSSFGSCILTQRQTRSRGRHR